MANYFTSLALLASMAVGLPGSSTTAFRREGRSGMFSSDEILEQFARGTASKDSLAALFQAKAKPNGDGFSLEPLPPDLTSVTILPDPEHHQAHPVIESLEVVFSATSKTALAQVQPGKCSQWKRAPYIHGSAPFLYSCIVELGNGRRVSVFAGMTHAIDDHETHLSSLLFTH